VRIASVCMVNPTSTGNKDDGDDDEGTGLTEHSRKVNVDGPCSGNVVDELELDDEPCRYERCFLPSSEALDVKNSNDRYDSSYRLDLFDQSSFIELIMQSVK
jgi:hypothetical protein